MTALRRFYDGDRRRDHVTLTQHEVNSLSFVVDEEDPRRQTAAATSPPAAVAGTLVVYRRRTRRHVAEAPDGGGGGAASGGWEGLAAPSPPDRCARCGARHSPMWRSGPAGPRTLCNACGIRYRKAKRKETPMEELSCTTGENSTARYGEEVAEAAAILMSISSHPSLDSLP
ncbi:uncharacterized protein LOC144712455 [Wolffia australiana]